MTNFQLITQNATTLDNFISAVVDDALEAKGCSMELKLPYEIKVQSLIQFSDSLAA